ncbi:MAG: hypothetical protein AAGA66_14570 [Bacteroidota bacterium]
MLTSQNHSHPFKTLGFLRKHLRVLATFLLFLFLNSLFAPGISYALTSGPTAPEATSFEPVDTTDMVNLLSGDLTYNLPLLEVPGPAGGYPLSLAYHAGIQPNEDASWVGLGWSLSTGSINRNVNGYPDDHQSVSNVDRTYWEGGSTESFKIGVSVGIANSPATVSAGLSISNDTYQGFGTGHYLGIGASFFQSDKVGIGVGFTTGVNPYGQSFFSGGMNAGLTMAQTDAVNLGSNISLNSNFGVSGGVGLSMNHRASGGQSWSHSLVGYSIGSNGSSGSLSVGGGSTGIRNDRAGNISTKSNSFGIDLPTVVLPGVNLSLGYNYTRYWSDETATAKTNGALYAPTEEVTDFRNNTFDSYTLPDPKDTVKFASGAPSGFVTDPEKSLGLSFPNFDNYYVNAQGLSGTIRPYVYKSLVFKQDRYDLDGGMDIQQYPYEAASYRDDPIEFRFSNDFSNRYLNDGGQFGEGSPIRAAFGASEVTGENGDNGIVNNHLAGSKHIEWYTHNQILGSDNTEKNPRLDGFIDCEVPGFDRTNYPGKQIGAFKITNESGVTYHFALPAYSSEEYQYSEAIDKSNGTNFNELKKPREYAYNWFLTGITGPDFVDRGIIGQLDASDWGYWVAFEYGQWTDDFKWRNPSEGFRRDLDESFQNYSSGKKELYYLDAVRTATHTAVFVKHVRRDGKGVTDLRGDGGFTPVIGACDEEKIYPTSVLGLREILLVRNEDFDIVDLNRLREEGTGYRYQGSFVCTDCNVACESGSRTEIIGNHQGDHLVDETDSSIRTLRENAIRAIRLNTDYALAPQTDNSLDNGLLYSSRPVLREGGKLTLNSIEMLGRGAEKVMPPITFGYDIASPVVASATLEADAVDDQGTSSTLSVKGFDEAFINEIQPRKILKFRQGGVWKYAKVLRLERSDELILVRIGDQPFSSGRIEDLQFTKNVPYNRTSYDVWNGYNVDVEEGNPPPQNRVLSSGGAGFVDVWSLRTIGTSYGSTINIHYESDTYSEIVLKKAFQFPIDRYSEVGLEEDVLTYSGDMNLKPGDSVELLILERYKTALSPCTSLNSQTRLYKREVLRASPGIIYFKGAPPSTLCPELDFRVLTGYVGTSKPFTRYGGGLRVRSIEVESDGLRYRTRYDYHNSGVTTHEPTGIGEVPKIEANKLGKFTNLGDLRFQKEQYRKRLQETIDDLLPVAREIPAPGVMYSKVTVREAVQRPNGYFHTLPSYSTYEFETFKPYMAGMVINSDEKELNPGVINGQSYSEIHKRDLTLKDYTSRVGNLKKVTLYNHPVRSPHPPEIVSETYYHYLHDEAGTTGLADQVNEYEPLLAAFKQQGVIQETYLDARVIEPKARRSPLYGIVSRRHTYPSIKTGETVVNHRTGITTNTRNLAYDFYSGAELKTLSEDGLGNHYVTEKLPAYKRAPYSEMGLMIDGGKNMLTQQAGSFSVT